MRLVAAPNVEIPAILLLEERGYTVTVSHTVDAEQRTAKRHDAEVSGDSPLQLLALTNLVEARGPTWQATDEQIHDTLIRFGIGHSDVCRR